MSVVSIVCKKCGSTNLSPLGRCRACACESTKRYMANNYDVVRARANSQRRAKNAIKNAGKIKYSSRAESSAAWKRDNPEKVKLYVERGKAKATLPLAHGELLGLLSYEPTEGLFRWIKDPGRGIPAGTEAGCVDKDGYRNITVKCKRYLAHRLAWFYVHGALPTFDLDHINRDRSDNRIANLRKSCDVENGQNKGVAKNNKSGARGVHWCKTYSKWRAGIRVGGKQIDLGRFDTVKEAAQAYAQASKVHHPFNTILENTNAI